MMITITDMIATMIETETQMTTMITEEVEEAAHTLITPGKGKERMQVMDQVITGQEMMDGLTAYSEIKNIENNFNT
jgi:hypothetical protein